MSESTTENTIYDACKVKFSFFEIMDVDFTGVEINIENAIYTNFNKSEYKNCVCESEKVNQENFICSCDGDSNVYLNQTEEFTFPNKETALQIIKSGGYFQKN